MRKALFLVLAAFAAPALAQQKISIVAFDGPGGATVRNQVVAALCDTAECVPQAKVSAGGKPDWKKAKKLGVKFFVDGTVTKKGAKGTVALTVANKPGKPRFRKIFALSGGELKDKQLAQATAFLTRSMGLGGGGKAEPEEKKEEKKEEKEEKEEKVEKKEEKKVEEEDPPRKKKKEEPKEEKEEKEEKKEEPKEEKKEESDDGEAKEVKHMVLGVDLGVEGAGKYFSYTQTLSQNLRSYNAPFTIAPAFKLEFFPLALFSQGLAAGLGIEGSAAFVVGLKSRLPSTTTNQPVAYPTSLFRVDFGAKFRIRPFAGSDAAIVPAVGLRIHSFKVGSADDGSVIDGLPGVSYTAIKLGLGGEIPIGERLAFGASFTAMPLVGFGELISPAWFPKGGGFGFDINAFMTFKIAGPLHLKVAGNFTRYGMSFETTDTDPYRATGAVDIHAGGFVGVRLAF